MLRLPPPYGPALGLLETASIARGVVVCDALVKRAPVRLLWTEALTPGKYVILFDGGEAEVEEAFRAAVDRARDSIVDSLLLTQPDPQLWRELSKPAQPPELDSVAVLETLSLASTLAAADAAVKAADVTLFQLHLAKGIGGKGWFALSGRLDRIEAAVEAGSRAVPAGLLVGVEIVPRPHEDLAGGVL
jgi:microcompartment protein CcmL/EutN